MRCFDLMGVARLGPGSEAAVAQYMEAYGPEQAGGELDKRARLLMFGLNLAAVWFLAMVTLGFALTLGGMSIVGVVLMITPCCLAVGLTFYLRYEGKHGRSVERWG